MDVPSGHSNTNGTLVFELTFKICDFISTVLLISKLIKHSKYPNISELFCQIRDEFESFVGIECDQREALTRTIVVRVLPRQAQTRIEKETTSALEVYISIGLISATRPETWTLIVGLKINIKHEFRRWLNDYNLLVNELVVDISGELSSHCHANL